MQHGYRRIFRSNELVSHRLTASFIDVWDISRFHSIDVSTVSLPKQIYVYKFHNHRMSSCVTHVKINSRHVSARIINYFLIQTRDASYPINPRT